MSDQNRELLKLQKESASEEKKQNNSAYSETKHMYVKKTPFGLIQRTSGDKWEITIGNDVVSKRKFKYAWMAKAYIRTKPWMLTLTAAMILSTSKK